MSDWRTNPRQGRSKFLPLKDEIKQRLDNGETQKMIFKSYPELMMGYPQFTRYVKQYCIENNKVFHEPSKNKNESIVNEETIPVSNSIRNPSDLRKMRNKRIDLNELQESQGNDDESSSS